jgi:hypothetical protein
LSIPRARRAYADEEALVSDRVRRVNYCYLLVGEPERPLDRLEPLLKMPYYYLSPGWLKIDPTFDTLRGHPHFERLVNGS